MSFNPFGRSIILIRVIGGIVEQLHYAMRANVQIEGRYAVTNWINIPEFEHQSSTIARLRRSRLVWSLGCYPAASSPPFFPRLCNLFFFRLNEKKERSYLPAKWSRCVLQRWQINAGVGPIAFTTCLLSMCRQHSTLGSSAKVFLSFKNSSN